MALWLYFHSYDNMKNLTSLSLLFFLLLALASCGSGGGNFKISGRLLQMNQGEFYIYSSDASINGFDTIKVQGGRFQYELPCSHATTLTLVFPNFSEQPVFAEPGKSVKIEGDASHLKELEVKGTDDNELMTAFRAQVASVAPPEIPRYVSKFVEENPASQVGVWLVRKYLVATAKPDYKEASRLMKLMLQKQKDNGMLQRLTHELEQLKAIGTGNRLPSFTLTDTEGKKISSATLSKGKTVICTFAAWNSASNNLLRSLQNVKNDDSSINIIAISLDPSKKDFEFMIQMNKISFPIVWTGEMFDTKVLAQLGMKEVPYSIVVRNGRIAERGLSTNDLIDKIKK